MQNAVAATVEHFGTLDALVNNAGIMLTNPILGADVSEWKRMVDTNLLGSMYAVHAALPHLLESKGAVVQISSTSGRTASAASGVYSATKFGINAFSDSLRQEVTAQGVRVVVIEPGFISTELASHITNPAIQEMAKSDGRLDPDAPAGRHRQRRRLRAHPARPCRRQRDPDPPDRPDPVAPRAG